MDDKDYVDELVLYLLRKDAEELEAAGSSRNFRSDDVGHANPETDHREIQVNSWLESDTNFSASSFFPETGVASSLPTPFSIQGYGSSFDIPNWASLAGAQQNISEAPEESPANSFLVPVETARGDFFRTDDTLSNPSEHSSTQHNSGWSNWGQVPQKSLGAYDSTRRKRENNPAEFFPRKTLAHSDSAWSTQISMERGRNEAMAQTEENYRELSSTSSIFSPIIDISSMEMAPDRISLGSVAAAEAVSSGGPSGIRTRSDQTGKDKSFKCDVCGKIFGQKRSLDVHNRTHTGEKPFVCSTCGRGFGQQGNLKRHRLTHTGEKSFPCDICGKSFARKVHLDSHLRTHTGEKPFKCEFCDECFPSQGNRIRHQKRKHARMLDTLPLSFNDEK